MTTDRDIKNLEDRLGYFLKASRYAKKSNLLEMFIQPMMSVGRVCLFGGAIRDLMFQRSSEFSSDLDFVVKVEDLAGFEDLVTKLNSVQNSFGGYRTCFNGYQIDFWNVDHTWVNRDDTLTSVENLEDLIETTFFNLDAAIYDLASKRVHVKKCFSRGIADRLLDINLETNPNPDGAAVRAIRRMWDYDLRATDNLVSFICNRIQSSGWDELVLRDRQAYPSKPILCSVFKESISSPEHFKAKLDENRALPKRCQLSLPV